MVNNFKLTINVNQLYIVKQQKQMYTNKIILRIFQIILK